MRKVCGICIFFVVAVAIVAFALCFTLIGEQHVVLAESKVQITIEIDDKETEYGDDLAELTARIVDGSLKDGDTLADVVSLEIDGDTRFVGTFDIIATAINNNYIVTCEVPGTYTVTVTAKDDSYYTGSVNVEYTIGKAE